MLTLDFLKIVLITRTPSRIELNTCDEVKPIVNPIAPVPIKRRMAVRISFTIEDEIIMMGNDLVFSEEMTTERNNIERAEDPTNNIAISKRGRLNSKVFSIQF